MSKEDIGLLIIASMVFIVIIINVLDKKTKPQTKEKILHFLQVFGIVIWNILKWTLLIGITLIVGLFSILLGVSPKAGMNGAIQRKKYNKKH